MEGLLSLCISNEENEELIAVPSKEEIWTAVKQIRTRKVPGPDGLTTLFYKQYWPIVKTEMVAMNQNVFRSGFLLSKLNHTNIALIPKLENPTWVSNYWPISLCNVSYKILSKIFSNCLRIVLPRLISPMQVAFDAKEGDSRKFFPCS